MKGEIEAGTEREKATWGVEKRQDASLPQPVEREEQERKKKQRKYGKRKKNNELTGVQSEYKLMKSGVTQ